MVPSWLGGSHRWGRPPWHLMPHLTSHHGRVEAPEAERQHLRLDPNTLSLSLARPNKKAAGIRSVRRDLIGPRVAPL